MRIILKGVNREPERYGSRPQEVDLIIDIEDEVTFQIDEKIVTVTRKEATAALSLLREG